MSMKINATKTEIMVIGEKYESLVISIDQTPLKYAPTFKYLGSLFRDDASAMEEVKARLSKARSRMAELKLLWRSHDISTATKARIIQILE